MDKKMFSVTAGALLHDIGKVIYRSGIDGKQHSMSGAEFLKSYTDDEDVLDSVKYHHKQQIKGGKLEKDSPAYIVYIADNISSGMDRREIEGDAKSGKPFDKAAQLASVFNLLNGNSDSRTYRFEGLGESEEINFPESKSRNLSSQGFYNSTCQKLRDSFKSVSFEPEYINSLMEICEAHMTYIPSSTAQGEVADISLYDHQKTTAGIASCIYSYLLAEGISDFEKELLQNEKGFYGKKVFLMASMDISGIQQFIYTIASKGALRGLRSRSFYLEIMLEHIVDELLEECGLSRVNLIYTGGGHSYLLLPNTAEVRDLIEKSKARINSWLMRRFGTSLYLAVGYQECSSSDLMNKSEDQEAYQNIFRGLSRKLSLEKMRRYGAEEIMLLNSISGRCTDGRECSVCGAVDELKADRDGRDICSTCSSIQDLSSRIIKENALLISSKSRISRAPAFEMPSLTADSSYIHVCEENEVKELLRGRRDEIARIYGKNKMYTGIKLSTKLWMGDYAYAGKDGVATFEELASSSQGIERIAVLRADVDNLGAAFISGFVRENESEKYKYTTISRTSTLSRQLSLFFKHHINGIMKGRIGGGLEPFSLTGENKAEPRRTTIVYAGGDDMFIVGAWNEVIELGVDIRRAFEKFSGKTLTLSAGISMFYPSYPLSRMAEEAGSMEEMAKQMPGKNSVSLFGQEVSENGIQGRHTYSWEVFEDKVVGEKLRLIQETLSFDNGGVGESEKKTFIYSFMNAVKDIDKDRINIARCAYALARVSPGKGASQEKKEQYDKFSRQIYGWILDGQDRAELITAINIFIYLNREKSNEGEE